MIQLNQIKNFCKSKDFDVLQIDYDIPDITDRVKTILNQHELILKDGYQTYEAIGMQYADPANPLYDAVQQTAFVSQNNQINFRQPSRYIEKNEIGEEFDFIYDIFSEIGLERGRILKANPGHIHKDHFDYDIRIHLPVFTNPDCKMVYSDKEYHLEANKLYLINGFRLHHFYNKGEIERVHLVWLLNSNMYL